VIAAAKTDLTAGQVIDGLGGYATYGLCENSDLVKEQNLLPIGLAEGCRLKRDISKDEILSYEDIDLPEGRISDQLRAEQNEYFNAR
jgi:predicted homoserine dehydrogenase-like protein